MLYYGTMTPEQVELVLRLGLLDDVMNALHTLSRENVKKKQEQIVYSGCW